MGIDILMESDILKKEKRRFYINNQNKIDFKGGKSDGKVFKTNGNG